METILLNIDSRFRDKIAFPQSTQFSYTLPTLIKNVMSVSLVSFEFPNVYYTISAKRGNHRFRFNREHEITISDGNYELSELLEKISLQLSNHVADIQIVLSQTDGKIRISSMNAPLMTFDFKNETTNDDHPSETWRHYPTLGYLLGFRKDSYVDQTIIRGESVPLLNPETYFFLRLNDYGKVGMMFNEGLVFAKILNKVDKSEFLLASATASQFQYKTHSFRQPSNVSRFTIELLDSYGHVLDLLDLDFSFTLEIEYVVSSTVKHHWETHHHPSIFGGGGGGGS